MKRLVGFVRRALLDYMFEETAFIGVDFDHASQVCGSQSTLLAVRDYAIRFFDARHLAAGQNDC